MARLRPVANGCAALNYCARGGFRSRRARLARLLLGFLGDAACGGFRSGPAGLVRRLLLARLGQLDSGCGFLSGGARGSFCSPRTRLVRWRLSVLTRLRPVDNGRAVLGNGPGGSFRTRRDRPTCGCLRGA
ncbi:hypothetical protein [Streptomyces pathocidini]|uniref:hypothetical protein n=1 Tax=Streptomyces pathocidini TaxID=1650571 RepID=UPI0014707FC3|nr:hypothetical protein [Streptomyces pathocidini]